MPDLALLLQPGQRLERLGERALLRRGEAGHPQVDDVDRVDAEVAQVVLDRRAQLVGAQCLGPAALRRPPGAHLGDDDQLLRIGVQRLADELVDHVRAVVVAGVDVVHAQLDRPPEDGDRLGAVGRRAHHVRARELHRAVAEAEDGAVAEGVGAGGLCGADGHGRLPTRGRPVMRGFSALRQAPARRGRPRATAQPSDGGRRAGPTTRCRRRRRPGRRPPTWGR